MTTFDYKPALLAGRLSYDLDDDFLVCRDLDKVEKWRINWGEIASAAYVEHKVRRSRMRRLDLLRAGQAGQAGQNERRSISFTGAPGNPASDPDGVVQLDLMAAILDRLAARDPDFAVGIGEYGGYRIAMFVFGVLSVGFAVGLMVLVLVTGVPLDRIVAGTLPGLLLLAIGGALIYSHAPWRKRPRLPATTFALVLRRMAHPETDPADGRAPEP